MLCYLRYSKPQSDASYDKQVTVDPVRQFVDAAIGINVFSCSDVR